MEISEDFKRILANFNKVDERIFLANINDFAEKNKETTLKIYAGLLREENINTLLKYLTLKSIGELKYQEFIPMIRELLNQGAKVHIIHAAIDSLVCINTIEAYKTIARYLRENPGMDFKLPIEERLKELFSKNRLLYHFDVFYRDREGEHLINVEKSSEYLVKYLPDTYVKDILPALSSKFYDIRYEALKVLKNRPNPLYYIPICNHFKAYAGSVDEKFFLLLSETLVANARLSKWRHKIFPSLKEQLEELAGNKRLIFAIKLLKLNTPEMMPEIIALYPQLDYEGKRLVLDNLKLENHECYLDFIRRLLTEENSDELTAKIMEILIHAQDFAYIFQVIRNERTRRKEILLEILCRLAPPGLHGYVQEFVHSSQEDRILYLSLEYLLHHAADEYFATIQNIFFSGVPHEIKSMIMRNIGNFSPFNQKCFMESVFKDIKVIHHFKKEFLFSMLVLMNEKKFSRDFEDLLLNRILIMMEEANIDEIINFIYFFDKYEVNNRKDLGLIINELRLLQGMILKLGHQDELVRTIYILIKNIENRAILKRIPAI
ncbi:MAG TPA: hypothetical protein VK186_15315 [Candidatus Deferrimicrobium sp.]|nr:hypothetical protein [Candidatus Deferrimicrobium sp.]